jgi:hypothetical protein
VVALAAIALSSSLARAQDAPPATTPPPPPPPEAVEPPPPVPPETSPPETSLPPPPTPVVGVIGTTCTESAYAVARSSIVTVESGGRHGAGALVIDQGHVVTALRIVEMGHGIAVIDGEGNRREARIVVTADDDGLVLLAFDSPLPGQPMAIADWEAVTVGRPVVVLAIPDHDAPRGMPGSMRGTLPWAASEGIVSARGERAIQTDARIRAPIGSPIVGCDGAIVAMLGREHETMMMTARAMPAVPAIADIASRADHPEGYGGRWKLIGGIALSGAYEDPEWLWGVSLSIGVIALDAIVLVGRAHYFFDNDDPTGSSVLSVHNERFRGDAYLGWRQILAFGRFAMHFELALGASVTRVRTESRSAEIVDAGTGPSLSWREDTLEAWSVRPMAVVNLIHGPMVASYTLELDIDREHLLHVFDLGVRF